MRESLFFKLRPIQLLPEPGLPSVRSHIHPSGTRGEFILKLRWREIIIFLFFKVKHILRRIHYKDFFLPTLSAYLKVKFVFLLYLRLSSNKRTRRQTTWILNHRGKLRLSIYLRRFKYKTAK